MNFRLCYLYIIFWNICFFVFSSFAYAESAIDITDFTYNNPIHRGSLLTVQYDGPRRISDFAISVRQSDTIDIAATTGFRHRDTLGIHKWVAFLGIPSTVAPGTYTLLIHLGSSLSHEDIMLEVVILDREFVHEVIPLTSRLTEIRTKPDPEKLSQTQEYLRVINTVDTNAIFSTGMLRIPIDTQRLTSYFGDRRTYVYDDGSKGYAIHNGIDYAAPIGTPVYATTSGRVRMAQERIVTGNSVVIEHLPGIMSVYFHLNTMNVTKDQIVSQGQQIGTVGTTGLSTGAHLHWELRAGGSAIDPHLYLNHLFLY